MTYEDGTSVPVHLSKCTMEDNDLKYVVRDKEGHNLSTYKQHLKCPDELNISTILIKPADYEKSLPNLTEEELKYISNPGQMNPIAQLWLGYHSGIKTLS